MKRITIFGFLSSLVLCTAIAMAGDQAAPQQKERSSDSWKGWLGVAIQDITPQMEKAMDLKSRDGALVNEVVKKSPAESAGILEGDVIVKYGDKNIQDSDDLQKAVAGTKPDTKVSVTVMRKGDRKGVDVVIGRQPQRREFAAVMPRGFGGFEVFGASAQVQGMSLRQLNDQLGQYFGVPEGTGVLVWEVEKGSAAEKAGVKAGDVITVVGKKKIRELRDVSRALGIYDEGEKADIEIVRKGAHQTLSLEVKENGDESGHQFWFNAPSSPRWRHDEFFDGAPFGIKVPRIEIETLQPEMDQLRIEMDQLRDKLHNDSGQLRDKILKEVRPLIRIRIREEI